MDGSVFKKKRKTSLQMILIVITRESFCNPTTKILLDAIYSGTPGIWETFSPVVLNPPMLPSFNTVPCLVVIPNRKIIFSCNFAAVMKYTVNI